MEDEKEIFKTNPAIAERQKYNELISELTPILTKIKSSSSLNKNNFSRNTREINNGLRMISHGISVDSLRYENARKGKNPRFTQDYIQQLQQGTANNTQLPEVNEVSDIINALNNIKQEDVNNVMNLDWSSPASLFKINPKILRQFYNFEKTINSWVKKNNYKQGGILKRVESGKSGIHIKPENKGTFNATKARTGKSTEELTHSKNPVTRKRAIFAQNAAKWNHK